MPARMYANFLWKYFERKCDKDKTARCRLCGNVLSYVSSTGNLKAHLRNIHRDCYLRVMEVQAKQKKGSRNNEEENRGGTTVKFSSEIWRQFEHEDDEAKCKICSETFQNTIDDMKNHLEENHTSLLDDIIKKAQKGLDSDDNSPEDDNLYTEIVYLEDETRNRNSSSKQRRKSRYEQSPKLRQKRDRVTSDSSSDEVLKKPKETQKTPDDLDLFMTYIGSLLRKVPKEIAPKLHLDIINLIMNATIKAQDKAQGIIIETLDESNAGSTQNHPRVITVPIHNLLKVNDSGSVSIPPLYVSNVKYTNANTISVAGMSEEVEADGDNPK